MIVNEEIDRRARQAKENVSKTFALPHHIHNTSLYAKIKCHNLQKYSPKTRHSGLTSSQSQFSLSKVIEIILQVGKQRQQRHQDEFEQAAANEEHMEGLRRRQEKKVEAALRSRAR